MNSNLIVIGKTTNENDKEDFDNEADDDDADNAEESEGEEFEQETSWGCCTSTRNCYYTFGLLGEIFVLSFSSIHILDLLLSIDLSFISTFVLYLLFYYT